MENKNTSIILRIVENANALVDKPKVGEICYIRNTDLVSSIPYGSEEVHIQKWALNAPKEMYEVYLGEDFSVSPKNEMVKGVFEVELSETDIFTEKLFEERGYGFTRFGEDVFRNGAGEIVVSCRNGSNGSKKWFIYDDDFSLIEVINKNSGSDYVYRRKIEFTKGKYVFEQTSRDYTDGYKLKSCLRVYYRGTDNFYEICMEPEEGWESFGLGLDDFTVDYETGKIYTFFEEYKIENYSYVKRYYFVVFDIVGNLLDKIEIQQNQIGIIKAESDYLYASNSGKTYILTKDTYSVVKEFNFPFSTFSMNSKFIFFSTGDSIKIVRREDFAVIGGLHSPYPINSGGFGHSVACNEKFVAVGCPTHNIDDTMAGREIGSCILYKIDGESFTYFKELLPPDPFFGGNHYNGIYLYSNFGSSVLFGLNGFLSVGAPGDGELFYDPYQDNYTAGALYNFYFGEKYEEFLYLNGKWNLLPWGRTKEFIEKYYEPNYHTPEKFPYLGKYSFSMEEDYEPVEEKDLVTREYVLEKSSQSGPNLDDIFLRIDGLNTMQIRYSPRKDKYGNVVTRDYFENSGDCEYAPPTHNTFKDGEIWYDELNDKVTLSGISETIIALEKDIGSGYFYGNKTIIDIDRDYLIVAGNKIDLNTKSVIHTYSDFSYVISTSIDKKSDVVAISGGDELSGEKVIKLYQRGDNTFLTSFVDPTGTNNFAKTMFVRNGKIFFISDYSYSKVSDLSFNEIATFSNGSGNSFGTDGNILISGFGYSSGDAAGIIFYNVDPFSSLGSKELGSIWRRPVPEYENLGSCVRVLGGRFIIADYEFGGSGTDYGRVIIGNTAGSLIQILENPVPDTELRFGQCVGLNSTLYFASSVANGGFISIYNLNGDLLHTIENPNPDLYYLFGINFACNERYLAVLGNSDKVILYDLKPYL